jgi:hypothetical protein
MAEYSDEELKRTLERVHQWGKEWWESRYAQELADEHKEEAEFVIGSFGEYMYSYHGLLPEEWDEPSLEECCLDTLARKISADESYYRAMAPVLASFFTFLDETGRLRGASRLARRVRSIADQIVEHGSNPRYWGMAKSFVMGAKAAGVDPTNEAELTAYSLQQNLDALLPPAFDPLTPARVVKIGRNEPCPCGSGKKYKKCCGR